MKCQFADAKWLTYGSQCGERADFIITSHVLGYPSGKVGSGTPFRLCLTHLSLKFAEFVSDPGKQAFGITVMRLHEDDKIVLTPRFERETKEITQ